MKDHPDQSSQIGIDQLIHNKGGQNGGADSERDVFDYQEVPQVEMVDGNEPGLPFPVNADSSDPDLGSRRFNRGESSRDEEESKGAPVIGAPMIESSESANSRSASAS